MQLKGKRLPVSRGLFIAILNISVIIVLSLGIGAKGCGTKSSNHNEPASGSSVFKAPSDLGANQTAPTSVTLTWIDNSESSKGFKIERATGITGTYTQIATTGIHEVSYLDTGLLDGTFYRYRVRAYNVAHKNSDYSRVDSVTTTLIAPSSLNVTVMSPTQIDLDWHDNSNAEDGYKIERKTGAGGTYEEIDMVAADATGYSDTTVINGDVYYYRVRAYNAIINSAYSNDASTTILLNAPTGLNATGITTSQVNLQWTDNTTKEEGYKVERKTGVAGTYARIAVTDINVTTYTDTTLIDGTVYYYQVQAYNGSVTSTYSNEVPVTTTIKAPSSLITTTVTSVQVDLSWTDNSSSESGFSLERKLGLLGVYGTISTIVGADITSYIDAGLVEASDYYYRVRANNATGNSAYSNVLLASTLLNAPSVLTATLASATQVNLAWTDNSSYESGFKIERKIGIGGTYVELAAVGADSSFYGDTELTRGVLYYYRVKAYDENDSSINSVYSNEVSIATPINPPSVLAVAIFSSSQMNLSWADNSANELGFIIERKVGIAGVYAIINSVGANMTSYSDTGLAAGEGTDYYYRVRAYNSTGFSNYSNEVSATKPLNAPSALTATTVSASHINISWSDNSAVETGYKIERKTGINGTYAEIDMVGNNVTSYLSAGLATGTLYYYRVRAYNNSGATSDYSNEAGDTTIFILDAPSGLSLTVVSTSQINISWQDNSASEDSFTLERHEGLTGTYAVITTTVSNVTIYSDTALTPATYFCYRVRAHSGSGYSDYSSERAVFTWGVWSATILTNAPISRYEHTAVWTGTDMIVWGGYTPGAYLDGGSIYSPTVNSWTSITTTGAPVGRIGCPAIWSTTTNEMIIWGGHYYDASLAGEDKNHYLPGGGLYSPSTDSWTIMDQWPGSRTNHTAVWTGESMIIWGGYGYNNIDDSSSGYLNSGYVFDPASNFWSLKLPSENAPTGRKWHSMVFTGSNNLGTEPWRHEIIIWGGYNGNYLNDGGIYHMETGIWFSMPTENAPSARCGHTTIWTGSKMLVWGGYNGSSYLNTGGVYDPETNTWTPMSTVNAPSARMDHTAIWTGTVMVVWGGGIAPGTGTGGIYDPQTDTWSTISMTSAPFQRGRHVAAWDDIHKSMIIWGGWDGVKYFNTGGLYTVQ